MALKKLQHDMTCYEKESTKFIPSDCYYIIHVTYQSAQKIDLQALADASLYTEPEPIAVYYSTNKLLLIMSCVPDGTSHEYNGDVNLIVSKYVYYFTKQLFIQESKQPISVDKLANISAKIVKFSTRTEIVTYLSFVMYQTQQHAMMRLSQGTITTKELQFCTENELKDILQKGGVDWDAQDDFTKYGMILRLKRKKSVISVENICEQFDAREIKRYIHFLFE